MGIILTLLLCFMDFVSPPTVGICPQGWFIDGIRDGFYRCHQEDGDIEYGRYLECGPGKQAVTPIDYRRLYVACVVIEKS